MPYFNEPSDCRRPQTFGKLRHISDVDAESQGSSVDYTNRGWWTSRTGLEQKLIILSSVLFIVGFSLTITTIVYKNRSGTAISTCTCSSTDRTTVSPPPITSTAATGETSVTGDTSPQTDPTASSSSEASASPSPPSSSESKPSQTPGSTPTPKPETTTTEVGPHEKSSHLMALLKEANRINAILEKQKLSGA